MFRDPIERQDGSCYGHSFFLVECNAVRSWPGDAFGCHG